MLTYVVVPVLFIAVVAVLRGPRVVQANLPPSEQPISFPPLSAGRPARHRRYEVEVHEHRHWGVTWRRFRGGIGAGWALHVGVGRLCLAVDVFDNGRRP